MVITKKTSVSIIENLGADSKQIVHTINNIIGDEIVDLISIDLDTSLFLSKDGHLSVYCLLNTNWQLQAQKRLQLSAKEIPCSVDLIPTTSSIVVTQIRSSSKVSITQNSMTQSSNLLRKYRIVLALYQLKLERNKISHLNSNSFEVYGSPEEENTIDIEVKIWRDQQNDNHETFIAIIIKKNESELLIFKLIDGNRPSFELLKKIDLKDQIINCSSLENSLWMLSQSGEINLFI